MTTKMTSSTQEWFFLLLPMNVLALFRVCPTYNTCLLLYKPPCLVFDGFFTDVRVTTIRIYLVANCSLSQSFVKVDHSDSLHSLH